MKISPARTRFGTTQMMGIGSPSLTSYNDKAYHQKDVIIGYIDSFLFRRTMLPEKFLVFTRPGQLVRRASESEYNVKGE